MLLYSCVQKNLIAWLIRPSKKYVEYLHTKSLLNLNGSVIPALHAWDNPQAVQSHKSKKYFNAIFKFPLGKFLTVTLRCW